MAKRSIFMWIFGWCASDEVWIEIWVILRINSLNLHTIFLDQQPHPFGDKMVHIYVKVNGRASDIQGIKNLVKLCRNLCEFTYSFLRIPATSKWLQKNTAWEYYWEMGHIIDNLSMKMRIDFLISLRLI